MAANAADLIRIHEKNKSERAPFTDHWRECCLYTYPQLAQMWNGTSIAQKDTGASDRAKLLDSTGTDAARTLASTLVSGMTPANAQWLELRPAGIEKQDSVAHYLSEVSEVLWRNIHASNFDAEVFPSMLDFVNVGSFVLFIDINRAKGGFHFEQWPTNECYWSSSTGGTVDTLSREYSLTAAEAFQHFGDAAGQDVKDAVQKDPGRKFNYLHVILPRQVYMIGGVTSKNMPFASVYIEQTGKRIVRESGFNEFPCVVPRCTRIPGTAYATGVTSDALPDIKELNHLKRMEKAATELAVSGMWIAEDDGVLNPYTVKVGPKKIIVANSVDSMKPLLTGADFKVAFTTEANLQAQIRRVMMADQLLMQGSSNMTATEVNERMNLIRQQLGPIYGRLQAEFLNPLVERCFMLMMRAGVFDAPPDELNDTEFHVHYDSPLARAQRLNEATAIQSSLGFLTNLQPAIPDILDNIDTDAAARELLETMGVPATVARSADDVAALRQRKADMAAQQQQGAMADQLAMQNASEQITAANQVTGANAA